jgi:aminoglycoside phosphotransferase (APT) family kinase protein
MVRAVVGDPEALSSGEACRGRAARYAILEDPEALKWLERHVRTHLQVAPQVPLSFSFPSRGKRTPVAVAHWDTSRAAVAKLFLSFNLFAANVSNQRHLGSLGLPVPLIQSWSIRSRVSAPRAYVTVEQHVSGPTPSEVPEERRREALDSIAASLAALHSRRRRYHGRIGLPRPGSYASFYLRRTLDRLERLAPLAAPARIQSLRRELRRVVGEIGRRSAYELIHGHVNPGNFLVTDASAFLIDLGAVHYGDSARDLVRALQRLCREPLEAERFSSRYFDRVEGAGEEAFRERAPFYSCDYLLRRTCTLAGRWQRRGTFDAAEIRSRVEERLDLCLELLRPGGPKLHEVQPGP